MTEFQTKCIDACQRFFQGIQLELRFHEESGKQPRLFFAKTEKFLVGKVVYGVHAIEVFVYVDEAGFMVDDKHWFICERPDFDSDEELIKRLVEKFQKYFNEADPRRPNV